MGLPAPRRDRDHPGRRGLGQIVDRRIFAGLYDVDRILAVLFALVALAGAANLFVVGGLESPPKVLVAPLEHLVIRSRHWHSCLSLNTPRPLRRGNVLSRCRAASVFESRLSGQHARIVRTNTARATAYFPFNFSISRAIFASRCDFAATSAACRVTAS